MCHRNTGTLSAPATVSVLGRADPKSILNFACRVSGKRARYFFACLGVLPFLSTTSFCAPFLINSLRIFLFFAA